MLILPFPARPELCLSDRCSAAPSAGQQLGGLHEPPTEPHGHDEEPKALAGAERTGFRWLSPGARPAQTSHQLSTTTLSTVSISPAIEAPRFSPYSSTLDVSASREVADEDGAPWPCL